jgi:glycine/D-amino acid oxidase-like deaminating enzyme
MDAEVIVVGAGVVGAALAYGLARAGQKVLVLDGGDRDFRAARANFGLVWVQGKGASQPQYAVFTRISSDLWPGFHDELARTAGTAVDYARPGGLAFCLSAEEFDKRRALLARMHNQASDDDTEMVERPALERMLPAIRLGPDVAGASFCRRDGHVNPLHLLAALHRAIPRLGGRIAWRSSVQAIRPKDGGFHLTGPAGNWTAPRVIVAAGLATGTLTAPLGLTVPLRPQRGQLLVTERLAPMLPYPCSGLRQTAEGTMMIGSTQEDVGMDGGVTVASSTKLARRALRVAPDLSRARLVRQWSGLRVLSPDGGPVYAEAPGHPGLFAAICHSGVTLAAAHALIVAAAISRGNLPEQTLPFTNGRFDVPLSA